MIWDVGMAEVKEPKHLKLVEVMEILRLSGGGYLKSWKVGP